MPDDTTLVCPDCGNSTLHSDEIASIMYPVNLTRSAEGDVELTYTGDSYEVIDEGTEYRNDLWCRSCGTQHSEADLVTRAEYLAGEDDSD